MGIATALYTSLTGLNASSTMLSVAGNNIANVNTTAYKRSQAHFETQISQRLSNGSAPSADLGGTNPSQVGLGTRLATISRDFTPGPLQPTGRNTDMAIDGNGFFIIDLGGSRFYSRAGSFALDRDFNLVNPDGGHVMGFGIDDNFNVVDGVLTQMNIPIGNLTIAEQTTEVKFSGNLNAGGDVATQGAVINMATLFSDPGATTFANAADTLDTLHNASGVQLFAVGDVITVTGITKGGAQLPNKTFEVGTDNTTGSDAFGNTLGDLMSFMQDILGIDTDTAAGVTIDDGSITIEGNMGTANDLTLQDANFIVNQSTTPTLPFEFSKAQQANGESVRTTFIAYDSLGNPLSIDVSVVLESKDNTGTTWRFYAQSEDDTDMARHLGSGIIKFDTNGGFVSATDNLISIDRNDTGAFSPQQIALTFKDPFGTVSALFDVRSQMSPLSQDGSPIGTLEDFSVSEDGTIVGIFSNSLLRNLGQIAMAQFANNEGLVEMGNNLYRPSVNSGIASIVAPGSSGAGRVIGRSLELSNVELADEFVTMINATTGFSASSRVLTTADRLMQELLASVR